MVTPTTPAALGAAAPPALERATSPNHTPKSGLPPLLGRGPRGIFRRTLPNTARGVGKGGTRMSPTVSVGEIARLARVMTWKRAGVDLFYGGAKAGIVADPASPDKEAILRAFARALSNKVPREYVMGLDMGLTEDDAAVVQNELKAGCPASTSAQLSTAVPVRHLTAGRKGQDCAGMRRKRSLNAWSVT
ncbi:hypothetical protein AQJ67_20045 [Streptomyces caeruleatus]|uniref:Glutamate/phenylalanine/leucine/valine/L-tryptophan dehydrogenase dimerisation domain-containing protein n=1 Tax=Streptomyces caeruleatus TaxID=661399 RepID=A0A117RPV9_9ACTN|nr:hypothetical protein AQJ67_20045 [Streptomyces caeruleatus]